MKPTPELNSRPNRGPKRRSENPPWFPCVHCGQPIVSDAYGTGHRNHCSFCLWSKHVDSAPGDCAADCSGAMDPVAVWVRKGGEWAIIHRCVRCGAMHSNRIAGDDSERVLISLAVRPLSLPPFPLERLAAHQE